MKIAILAGGNGKRLAPLSTPDLPKQFLPLLGSKSLLQQTAERFPYPIAVCTSAQHASLATKQVPSAQILIDPFLRNTAPAITFIVKELSQREDDLFCIVPSDHYWQSAEPLLEAIEKGKALAQQGKIVLFGVTPRYPEPDYGYIIKGEPLSFIEKPSVEQASELMAVSLWNTGMFLFQAGTFLKELSIHAPEVLTEDPPSISIDIALIQKTRCLTSIEIEGVWTDLGSPSRLEACYQLCCL